jgi:arylsulfatase A-like enzyme
MRSTPLLLGLSYLAGCASTEPEGEVDPRPSFVLLMADDQGWGEVGFRDHPYLETPNLDDMAESGLSLERFHAAAPVCSPTRASVLTGRHPNRSGCFAWGHELPADEETLAEVLGAQGYATGHFGKWHLGSVRAGAPTSPGEQGFDEWVSSPNYYDLDPTFSDRGEVIRTEGEGSDVTVDFALDFMRRANADGRPFLAVIWFGSPHLPHEARAEDMKGRRRVPEEMRAYCAEIEALDASVGRVRDELRELGIERDTLVWYTSDNGPRPLDDGDASTGGLRGRKSSLWEGGLRVPSLVEWPGRIPEESTSLAVTGTVDIFPTLLELATLDPDYEARRDQALEEDRELDGVSLATVLSDPRWTRRSPLGFWTVPAEGRTMFSDKFLSAIELGHDDPTPPPSNLEVRERLARGELAGTAAWIDGPFKLLSFEDADALRGRRYELYDLERDPTESVDLAVTERERVRSMAAALDDWRRSVAASFLF